MPVPAGENMEDVVPVVAPLPPAHHPLMEVADHDMIEGGDDRLLHGEVDIGPGAGQAPVANGEEDGRRPGQGGGVIGLVAAEPRRGAGGGARYVHLAAESGGNDIAGPVMPTGAGLAEGRHGQVDKPGILLLQNVKTQAGPLERSRRKRFDEAIAFAHKGSQQVLPGCLFNIKGNGAFIGIAIGKTKIFFGRNGLLAEWSSAPRPVCSGSIYPDDIGAQVREESGTESAPFIGKVENPYPA
mgnify:CR=1 FL=1